MGEVWLAEQLRPVRRQVAIKIVKAGMDSAQVVARFEAERQALAVMDHPAIAKVFDGGTTPEGRPYFAMEYCRGEAITAYCDRQRLSVRERLEIFIELCDGIQHAHQKGIIHRDLKPSNVLVTAVDDRHVPRIIDFGIAKAISQPLTERPLYTEVGGFIGTPEYMSPEQAELTPLDVDTRSDVYSLGVMLYELLVGTLPLDGPTLRREGFDEIRRAIREDDPVRPSTRLPHVAQSITVAERRRMPLRKLVSVLRGDLDWITMKALEKDRTRRYQTANALALDIRHHLANEPVSAGPPSAAYWTRKFVRRHRVGVSAAAALVLVLIVFAGVMTIQAGRIARERDRANDEAAVARTVSNFLVGLFRVSDPSEARGESLTAREVLDRGAVQLRDSLRDQPEVHARLQATIGQVYTSLGLYAEAQPLLERALDDQRRLLGEASPVTLTTANDLANVYWYQSKFADAEALYRTVIDLRARALGPEHADTLKTRFDFASVYAQQKQWDKFEPLATETLATQRRVLGNTHPDTIASINNLASAYAQQGRYDEALPITLEVVAARRRLLGERHPQTLTALHNLGFLYGRMGRNDEAERLLISVAEQRRRVLGGNHPSTLGTLRVLGDFFINVGRPLDAEPVLLESYAGSVARYGADHPNTQRLVRLLVDAYTAARQPAKADLWRRRLTP